MRRSSPLLRYLACALFLFLYAPIAVVVVYSFNASRFGADWGGFSTKWYSTLFDNELALAAAKNTLLLAVASAAISTLFGTMLGFGLSRFRFPAQRLFNRLLYVPVFIPDIVMAVSLLLFFAFVRNWIGLFELGLSTMVIAHVTFQIPFVAIIVRARLAGLDPALEEAAQDLGANEWQTFRHVTLPLILPGVIAAAMLAFTLSLDDFVVSFFTTGPGATTLPIYIYSSVKRGLTPDINALATLILLASVVATVSTTFLRRRDNQS